MNENIEHLPTYFFESEHLLKAQEKDFFITLPSILQNITKANSYGLQIEDVKFSSMYEKESSILEILRVTYDVNPKLKNELKTKELDLQLVLQTLKTPTTTLQEKNQKLKSCK